MQIKNPIIASFTLAFIVAFSAAAPAQELITNGSFETPVIGNTSILGIGLVPGVEVFDAGVNPGGITGFTVSSGDVSLVDAGGTLTSTLGLFTAYQGNQYVELNGLSTSVLGLGQIGTTGTLQQTLTGLNGGDTYQLSFAYRGLAVGALNGTPEVQVTVGNSASNTGPSGGLLSAGIGLNAWSTETFTFVANGGNSVLSFSEPNGGLANVGLVGLDGVSVTDLGMAPVPEPSQYGAAAIGFLVLLAGGRVVRRFSPARAECPSESMLAA